MNLDDASFVPTHPNNVELERLGDEIAELAAHLDAATARLLDLIREFDTRGGWGNGFASCAHWLAWRVGLALGAACEAVASRAAGCRSARGTTSSIGHMAGRRSCRISQCSVAGTTALSTKRAIR